MPAAGGWQRRIAANVGRAGDISAPPRNCRFTIREAVLRTGLPCEPRIDRFSSDQESTRRFFQDRFATAWMAPSQVCS